MSQGGLTDFYSAHVGEEASDFRFVALRELLTRHMKEGGVADIGCGTGMMARELARAGRDVLAVEPDESLFSIARRVHRDGGEGYELRKGSIEQLGREELRPYANVLLLDVLEHLPDDAGMLAAVREKLSPGSQLLCLLPAVEALYGERDRQVGHYRRYSARAARALFSKAGFNRVELIHWNLLGVPVYWFCEKVLRRRVPEGFRADAKGFVGRALHSILLAWFRAVENRVRPPIGLSILVKAVK